MGLFEYIESLQNKPEGHRHRVALGTSATITAVIGLVWLSSMTSGFGLADRGNSLEPVTQSPEQTASSFSSFRDEFSSTMDEFSEQWETMAESPTSTNASSSNEGTPFIDQNNSESSVVVPPEQSATTTSEATSSQDFIGTTSEFTWPQ